ncbi:MAG: extracellular solute-binding protein [Gammaproteobacteria bacterium]|nr:extracellular solute-binding protein [Gammaproteobacteria bacterium]
MKNQHIQGLKTAPANPSRRRFLETLAAVTASGSFLIPRFAHAQKKHQLRILQWNHFVPEFDQWFGEVFTKQWSERNDTEVIIDHVGMTSLNSRANAEIAAGVGHDLFMFLRPPPTYEDHAIDHREIYEECTRRFGVPLELAIKSTYNPKTRRYYGFSDSYVPNPINYRKDLWEDVDVFPDSWTEIRRGGAAIHQRHGIPVGIGLAPELDSNMALRSLLYSFGASVQTADGRPSLDTPQTLEAVRFMRALYKEAMTEEVFTWDPSSNNRMLLAGHGSLALNAISVTRTGESQKIPVTDRILLAPPARGSICRLGLIHLMPVYVIWKLARNIEGAKRFLVDYVGEFRNAFLASKFYNLPCFPRTVPDLEQLLAHDSAATPPDKYHFLLDAADWTTHVGYPGYANAAIDEIFSKRVISSMFAEAARGWMTTEEAVRGAAARASTIFDYWREAGKV